MNVCALKLPDARRVRWLSRAERGRGRLLQRQEWASGTVRVVSRAFGSLVRSARYEL